MIEIGRNASANPSNGAGGGVETSASVHGYGAGGAGRSHILERANLNPAGVPVFDPVNRPKHYNSHPSGIQCIEVTRHMGFNLGNVIKYLWRADLKNGTQDLEKAAWYLADEIARRKKAGQ